MSQQSISLVLRSLASSGFLAKQHSKNGERIFLTSKAYDRIAQELAGVSLPAIRDHLERRELVVTGTLFTGKGEGAYYVSQKEYSRQMHQRLGFVPYPGTMNLRLNGFEDVNKILLLHSLHPIKIEGFTTHERTFGDVFCYDVEIAGGPKIYLVRSERTSYDLTVVELISDVYLRKALRVEDGDTVRFSFFV